MLLIYTDWKFCSLQIGGHRGRDHMVDGFTTTYAIRAYHH